MFQKFPLAAGLVCLVGSAFGLVLLPNDSRMVQARSSDAPAYAATGDLLPPRNYRDWIYLSTGIDMSYSPKAGMPDRSMFDNVFVNPQAYRSFLASGTWPDKTVMVLEVRGAKNKGSINRQGHFQDTDIMGFEVHVRMSRGSPASGPSSISIRRRRTAR